jgi:CelD/BcsL family acetyltransferase involved in cellulose biosynthesis
MEAAVRAGAVAADEIGAPELEGIAGGWESLAEDLEAEVFHRYPFVRLWLETFAKGLRWRILTTREAGQLSAVLPLVEQRATLFGVPVRQLSSASNAHSCRFDLLSRSPKSDAQALIDHLLADDEWDVLRLCDVPEGGAAFALLDAARERGLPVGVWPAAESPYFPLPPSPERFLTGLNGRFRSGLKRRQRRLAEQGEVRLTRVDSEEGLEAALAEGFLLEASGWKGRNGTAILQHPHTHAFYDALAHQAARAGMLALYTLSLDGAPIAFHYGLFDRGRYLTLKSAYDEELRQFGPGQLLTLEAVRDCIGRGISSVDLLGEKTAAKLEWTDQVRPHGWLYVFRDSALGRALQAAKFRLLPGVKDLFARWQKP